MTIRSISDRALEEALKRWPLFPGETYRGEEARGLFVAGAEWADGEREARHQRLFVALEALARAVDADVAAYEAAHKATGAGQPLSEAKPYERAKRHYMGEVVAEWRALQSIEGNTGEDAGNG